MTDDEKKKYIEELFKHCSTESILVLNQTGSLERLFCPFEVVVIQDVGDLYAGLKCLVSAVKMDLTLVDVYIIKDKAYYCFNFKVLGSNRENSDK